MIFQSKLTVIMKFSLNIQEFLKDPKQDKGKHSVHYHSLCPLILFYCNFKCQWVRRKFSQRALCRGQIHFESANRHKLRKTKPNETKPAASCGQKPSCHFIKARRAEGKPARRHCGGTLPPAGHRNQNAASPEEDSSFLLGFRAEDWTVRTRKLRGMPVRTRERKGISRSGLSKPPLDNQPPRKHSNTRRKSGCPGRSGAWWAGLHSDWLALGLRAATQ